jgi:DNA ligase D-like protein (predicted ligase)
MPVKARFIEPMLLEATDTLPDNPTLYEYGLKLDGFRAIAFKSNGKVQLRSRNDNDFNRRYPSIVKGLAKLPDETVIDGEVVALDEHGKPSFSLLANMAGAASRKVPLLYYAFDLLVLAGRDVMREPLSVRRQLLEQHIVPTFIEPVRYAGPLDAPLPVLVEAVKAHGGEGVVSKRLNSPYEPGLRSGAWKKMRVNQGQEFVIGGYTIGSQTFDALIVGYYQGDDLIYVARVRNGFTPASRAQVFKKIRGREIAECPFANLPEAFAGRWSVGLTKEKMASCRWLKPELVAQVEFVEWTDGDHLRHTKFMGLRDDKRPRDVTRESRADE